MQYVGVLLFFTVYYIVNFKSRSIVRSTQMYPSKAEFVTSYEAHAASGTKGYDPIVSQNSPYLLSHQ